MTFRGVHKVCDRFLHGHLHFSFRSRSARLSAASRWKHSQADFDSQTNIYLRKKYLYIISFGALPKNECRAYFMVRAPEVAAIMLTTVLQSNAPIAVEIVSMVLHPSGIKPMQSRMNMVPS